MVTIGELAKTYRPGFVLGAVLGLIISIYLETLGNGVSSGVLGKILEYNMSSKGLLIIGIFALLGFIVQWRLGWK